MTKQISFLKLSSLNNDSCFADSVAYKKIVAALTNPILVKGIKQASPISQTSCVEGFHSLLNHFAPKMIAYSYIGMQCR